MKKTILLLLSILCVCCFVFAITGCNQDNKPTDSSIQSDTTNSDDTTSEGQEPNSSSQGQTTDSSEGQAPNSSSSGGGDVPPAIKHEHKYGEWVNDETNHWKECTATEGECDAPKTNIEKHTFDSESGKCTVCKFQQGVTFSYSEIKENDKVVAYSVTGVAPKDITSLDIPDKYNGLPITTIGGSAFYNLGNLTSVTIGENVTNIGNYAFEYCKNLTSITIPKSVTSIYYEAFDYCSKLNRVDIEDLTAWCKIKFSDDTSNPLVYAKNLYLNDKLVTNLVIPSGITAIEKYAFMNCESITSVTLPDSVTSIDERAFSNCKNLANITLGKNVKTIGKYAFASCKVLTLTIPDSVTSIGERAFYECDSLTDLTMGNGITSIGDYAFNYCSSLTNVYIKDLTCWCKIKFNGYNSNPLTPAKNLFVNGKLITDLAIPSGVTAIQNGTFCGLDSITSVTIGNNVTSIGASAFANCSKLASVTMGSGVTTISDEAFNFCEKLNKVNTDNLSAWCKIKFEDDSANPLFFAKNLYVNGGLVTNLEVPEGVTSINEYAFINCENLTSASVPDSATSIGSEAFKNCVNLASVTIGSGVTSVGREAFYKCTSLANVTMGSSVKIIDYEAFRDCSRLTSIILPASLTTIWDYAFAGCINLREVYNLPSLNITKGSTDFGYVGRYALGIYTSLDTPSKVSTTEDGFVFYEDGEEVNLMGYTGTKTDLVLPQKFNNKNYAINENAFSGNTNLTSVTIPDSVTSIGGSAFNGCTSLTSVAIGNGVTSIGHYAFYECTSLTSITIGSGVTSVGSYAFTYCNNLKDVYITDVSAWCKIKFYDRDCNPLDWAKNLYLNGQLLTDLVIPDGVTSIEPFAFYNCATITSVTIPESVTSIGTWAFYDCTGLTGVYIKDLSAWCKIKFGAGANPLNGNPLAVAENLYLNGELVTDIVIPEGITAIENYTFSGCNSLTSVTLPNGVTSIGSEAFSYCDKLTSITLPSSVTSIGNDAFDGCAGLNKVDINNLSAWCKIQFSEYDSNPLEYAKNLYVKGELLTDLVIPEEITSIQDNLFKNCESITKLTIHNGVTSIGKDAFGGCKNLTGVYITDLSAWCKFSFGTFSPNPLEYAKNLYLNGELVTNLVIPNDVTIIANGAFMGLGSITSVTIGNGVTTIGDSTFAKCDNLTSVTMGNSVKYISYSAFDYCNKLTDVNITDLSAWCNISFDNYGSNPLTCAENMYLNGKQVTDLVIPEGVTCIRDSAFHNFDTLTSVTLPDSVTDIDYDAFSYCDRLRSVTLGKGMSSIDWDAFSGCYKLVEVYNLSHLNITKGSDDYGCVAYYALGVYTSKDTLSKLSTTKDGFVFYEDGSEVYLVDYVGKETNLVLPDKFNNKNYAINKDAFRNRSDLTSVTIGNGVTSIGYSAFFNCTNLTSVTIGKVVTSIGNWAFETCFKLVEVYNFSSLNITKGGTDNGCVARCALDVYTSKGVVSTFTTTNDGFVFYENSDGIYLINYVGTETNLVLPDKFNGKNYAINNYAFYNCDTLTSVTIPNNVTSIGECAFSACGMLESVTIGASVTSIGRKAFVSCRNLKSVTFVDTANWSVTSDTTTENITVTDPAKNAQNFINTYSGRTWKKN